MLTAASQDIGIGTDRGARPTRIAVELKAGRARLCTLDQGYFLTGRPMQSSGNCIRLALVGVHLALLAGDVVDVQIKVGAGAVLEVIEPSGLVAYDAGGQRSTWRLTATVDAGATLIWRGAEFVAARGSNAQRSSELILAPDARVLLKETLVLGRSGESGIVLANRMAASLDGQELLVEELLLTPENRDLPGLAGASRVICTVMALGMRPSGETANAQRLDLAGPGALWRSLAPAAHTAEKASQPVFDRWREEALARSGS